MAHIQDQKFSELGLEKCVSEKGITSYQRGLEKASYDNPVLVLLHGYPQSAYMYEISITIMRSSNILDGAS